ncbi:roadblock/LC7 domain-containing protein [Desulfobotulus sp.]|uniref:roadblock/LC7 domain-containing protein n=1 Tax=Desulfobotulus sp. TaxID=1940337 RepID=UPI002A370371|nr:roadblock/LC7 domain-containing protein [Desulfobotulus sp.]MDY0161791.1 roadblock/LC7 domain-containing protein [Desulfobotulus sp.]
MEFTLDLDRRQIEKIEKILDEELIDLGVSNVILLDLAGNVIVNLDNGNTQHDVYSLAALAAGNFGAVSAMANLIGEQEFSLLFHKGETDSIHFSKVTDDLLLLSIFGKEVSLGFLRLKVTEAVRKIESLFG